MEKTLATKHLYNLNYDFNAYINKVINEKDTSKLVIHQLKKQLHEIKKETVDKCRILKKESINLCGRLSQTQNKSMSQTSLFFEYSSQLIKPAPLSPMQSSQPIKAPLTANLAESLSYKKPPPKPKFRIIEIDKSTSKFDLVQKAPQSVMSMYEDNYQSDKNSKKASLVIIDQLNNNNFQLLGNSMISNIRLSESIVLAPKENKGNSGLEDTSKGDQLSSENAAWMKEKDELAAKIIELEGDKKQLAYEVNELRAKVAQAASDKKKLQSSNQEKEKQVRDSANELQFMKNKEQDYERQKETLLNEMNKLKQNNVELIKAHKTLEEQVDKLKKKNESLSKQREDIAKEKEGISLRASTINSENRQLKMSQRDMSQQSISPQMLSLEIVYNKLLAQKRSIGLKIQSFSPFTQCQNNSRSQVIESENIQKKYFSFCLEIESLMNLVNGKGCKITSDLPPELAEKGRVIHLGFLGDSQTGKTALINRIFNAQIPEGPTKSLNFIHLKQFKQLVILDTPGLCSPIYVNKDEFSSAENEAKNRDFLIQQFVLDYSDFVYYFVNNNTRKTQKRINLIKAECLMRKITLYVVHNLPFLTTPDQIEQYAHTYINNRPNFLFIQKLISEKTLEQIEILHFLLGNSKFNPEQLSGIASRIQLMTSIDKLTVKNSICATIARNAKRIFNLPQDITEKDISMTASALKLKVVIPESQRCPIDKYDFFSYWKYNEALIPSYSYYVDNDFLVIEVEMVQCQPSRYNLKAVCDYFEFKLWATKTVANEKSLLYSTRKSGEVCLTVKIPMTFGSVITKINNRENKEGLVSLFFKRVK